MRTGGVRGPRQTLNMRNDPTSRALHLLSLLQTHRFWRSAELAERLATTERTVRRDIDRLRELDYTVDATPGRYGGYRLATGAHVPPLMLDDDEAVAVAIGLRSAAAIGGVEETALRALTKIEALLPQRLRRRVSALHQNVTALRRTDHGRDVAPDVLSLLAAACRDKEFVRSEYRRGDGESGRRHLEPHRLVTAGQRWYLVAWDVDRSDWRTLRVDRMAASRATGARFTPRDIPGGDATEFVARSIGATPRHLESRLVVHAGAEDLAGVLRWIDHTIIEAHSDRCVLIVRGEDVGRLSMSVARVALTARVQVVEPAELTDVIETLAGNLGRVTA